MQQRSPRAKRNIAHGDISRQRRYVARKNFMMIPKHQAIKASDRLSPRKCAAGFAAVVVLAVGATGARALPLTPFRYEDQAQRHCPGDTVVWLDFKKGRYYSKGQKLYGRGLDGNYVCREEARSSFYRRALIGSR